MKCAFVCWRPFQIFNAVNFIYHNYEGTQFISDIFILDITDNLNCIEGLKNCGLFKNIIVFSKKIWKNDWTTRLGIFLDYMYPKHALLRDIVSKENLSLYKEYDLLIGSGYLGFFVYLVELNPNAKVVLLEDGLISYQGDERLLRKNTLQNKILSKLFHKGNLCVAIECLYLNNIGLRADFYPYPVKELPSIDEDTIIILKKVFNCVNAKKYPVDKDIIFLDQPLNAEPCIDRSIESVILDTLELVKERIILRNHPNKKIDLARFTREEQRIMWELRAAEISNSHTLIGYFSTSQLTPYIIYGKAPRLVLLYKMILDHNSERYKNIEKLFFRFRSFYPGELLIPGSLNELESIIKRIAEKHKESV